MKSIYIESEQPLKRIRMKKKRPGELVSDDKIGSPEDDRLWIKVFNMVIDKLGGSTETRFVKRRAST